MRAAEIWAPRLSSLNVGMARRPRLALLVIGAFVAAAAIIRVVAFDTTTGARIDASALGGLLDMSGPRIHELAIMLVQLGDPAPVAVFAVAIVAIALRRRRPALAVTAGVALVGANITTQLLKLSLAAPRPVEPPRGGHVALQSWPSGHATASMTVALCLVMVAPERLRPLAAVIGAAATLGVVSSVLLLGWHLPSDVLGGFCVAAAWTLTGLAIVGMRRSADVRSRRRRGEAERLQRLVDAL
jgi:membrane-associated phospholipid phosphatase